MQRKRAFTLIELLVVIAIIAILAAILFPVFAKARERAKNSKSSSNIRQLAIAITSYAQDYGEAFPGWVSQNATNTAFAHNVWDEQINGNVKSKDVYNNGDTGIASPSQPAPRDRVLTYGLNGLLIADPTGTFDANWGAYNTNNPPAPKSNSSISNPAGTILLAELDTNQAWPTSGTFAAPNPLPVTRTTGTGTGASSAWNTAMYGAQGTPAGQGGPIDISPRQWVEIPGGNATSWYNDPYTNVDGKGVARNLYGGGGNYAFCDGHVQFLRIPKTVGIGTTNTANQAVTATNAWATNNTNNMWIPQ